MLKDRMEKIVKDIRDFCVKNYKLALPVIVILLVAITVLFALRVRARKAADSAASGGDNVVASGENMLESDPLLESSQMQGAEEVPLVANDNSALYSTVAAYYNAVAQGDEETLVSLYDNLSEVDLYRYKVTSEYLDYYTALDIYTKPGMTEESTLAYVYYKVRFMNHEEEFPGYQTLYICKNEKGSYYIKNEEGFTAEEVEYIKKVTTQDDVIDFTNRVNVEYNDLVTEKPELLDYLSELGNIINKAIGDALVNNNVTATPEVQNTEPPVTTEAPVENVDKYAVATTTVNIRKSDSESADRIGRLAEGTKVLVKEELVNGWTKIFHEGQEGFVKSEFLRVEGQAAVDEDPIGKVVAESNVNIRSEARDDSTKLGTLLGGASLKWLGNEGDWCKVIYKNQIAYVKAEFVNTIEE